MRYFKYGIMFGKIWSNGVKMYKRTERAKANRFK